MRIVGAQRIDIRGRNRNSITDPISIIIGDSQTIIFNFATCDFNLLISFLIISVSCWLFESLRLRLSKFNLAPNTLSIYIFKIISAVSNFYFFHILFFLRPGRFWGEYDFSDGGGNIRVDIYIFSLYILPATVKSGSKHCKKWLNERVHQRGNDRNYNRYTIPKWAIDLENTKL